jgi:hypothetical protein
VRETYVAGLVGDPSRGSPEPRKSLGNTPVEALQSRRWTRVRFPAPPPRFDSARFTLHAPLCRVNRAESLLRRCRLFVPEARPPGPHARGAPPSGPPGHTTLRFARPLKRCRCASFPAHPPPSHAALLVLVLAPLRTRTVALTSPRPVSEGRLTSRRLPVSGHARRRWSAYRRTSRPLVAVASCRWVRVRAVNVHWHFPPTRPRLASSAVAQPSWSRSVGGSAALGGL